MNINVAIGLFLLVIIVYTVIAGVFTVLFRISGVPRRKARFQVISLLTNSGYTTTESEIMLASPFRRKLCVNVMLFGYVFSATIISMIVNLAMTIPNSRAGDFGFHTVLLAIVFAVAIILLKLRPVRNAFEAKIEKWCKKKLAAEAKNAISLLDSFGENVLAQIYVKHVPEALRGIPAKELAENDAFGFRLILVKRAETELMGAELSTPVTEGDFLIVHGKTAELYRLFVFEQAAEKAENQCHTA